VSNILLPGTGIIFMKVGTHAGEPLSEIIRRKTREIDETGYALWGYGGNTCHPRTMVQPFCKDHAQSGSPIVLCMEKMDSNHFASQVRADQMSVDGVEWLDIPNTVNAIGSRFALKLSSLREEELVLPLEQTRVGIGKQQGRNGIEYIRGRVDKACLEITRREDSGVDQNEVRNININLVAELADPFAVFLRNRTR